MIDIATHTFKTNKRGLVALVILSVMAITPFLLFTCYFGDQLTQNAEGLVYLIMAIGISLYVFILLCRVWRLYRYAMQTTFIIDMKTYTMSYRSKTKSVTFQSSDIAHWYGMYVLPEIRDAQSPAYIVLKPSEILLLHPWLFDSAPNNGDSAICYIDKHPELLFPTPEKVPTRLHLTNKKTAF